MNRFIPIGYQTLSESLAQIENAMFAGLPERPVVAEIRAREGNVGDGEANQQARAVLWEAVDTGRVRPMAIGGDPRKVVQIPLALTDLPLLRRTGGFYLRRSNRHFEEIRSWFGARGLEGVVIAFHECDVKKLCRNLRRRTRRKIASANSGSKVGRPALRPSVHPCIKELVDARKWDATQSIKRLTRLVNRALHRSISEDTVARAFDEIHAASLDRRFFRHRRTRNA